MSPFEFLTSYMTIQTSDGQLQLSCTYVQFVEIMRKLISGVEIDADWSRTRYLDIADAIDRGEVPSPQTHFLGDEYFEGRLPFEIGKPGHQSGKGAGGGVLCSDRQAFDQSLPDGHQARAPLSSLWCCCTKQNSRHGLSLSKAKRQGRARSRCRPSSISQAA